MVRKMALKPTSTRDQILVLLKKQQELTVASVAAQLDITEMAVRRHLNTLEKDGYVKANLVRQSMGRPVNIYRLTSGGEELFPRDYSSLAIDMLRGTEQINGPDVVWELLLQRNNRLIRKHEKRLSSKDFDGKVNELARIQNEDGYMVELVREENGSYGLKQFNCPLFKAAKQFPDLCKAERALFQEMLSPADVKCETFMHSGQAPYCYYKINRTN
jgi:predicted ArsR family transcriptional regulator